MLEPLPQLEPDSAPAPTEPLADVASAMEHAREELKDARRELRNRHGRTLELVEALDELAIRTAERVGELEHHLSVFTMRLANVTRQVAFEQAVSEHDLTPAQRALLRRAHAGDKPEDLASWIADRLAAFVAPTQPTNLHPAEQARRMREERKG